MANCGEEAAAGATPFARALLEQAMAGAWYRDDAGELAPEAERRALAEAAMAELAPRDGPERIAASQMAAVHFAAMDALKWLSKADLKDSARLQALRLSAQLMTLSTRQLSGLDRHRAAVRAEAEALARARREARKAQVKKAAARPDDRAAASGVLVVPVSGPPEVEARRLADRAKANRRWFEAWQNGEAPTPTPPRESSPLVPGLPEATRTEGPGFLVVPETLSPEDWTRRVKEYNRLMSQPDDPPDP